MRLLHKLFLANLLLLITIAAIGNDAAIPRLQQYLKATFPNNELILDRPMLEQLAWVEGSAYRTSEMDASSGELTVHREIPRAMSRIFCIRQLREGKPENYTAFVAPQPEDGRLTRESFNHLSALMRRLSDAEYTALEASVILSSVTLSNSSLQQARKAIPEIELPNDTVQFLATTAPYAKAVYPLAAACEKQCPAINTLLTTLFLPDTHFRHMLYVEGGVGMYQHLGRLISQKQITRSGLDLWYAGWVANITGFRGHLSPHGSLYLTEDTYQSMQQLKLGLDRMLLQPGYTPLADYLGWKAERLGFNGRLDNGMSEFGLAWLATTLRVHRAQNAEQLVTAWYQLPNDTRKRLAAHVSRLLTQPDLPTPTYGPAVFANALAVCDGNIGKTLVQVLPAYFSALERAEELKKSGRMQTSVPVNFNLLASKESIEQLLASGPKTLIDVDSLTGAVQLVTLD
ncbi:hypothetical protein ACWJJH_11510 [Endozoicomonadaceae bacterium StTr2]